MANPNPPKHTQFKKGQSGNPGGKIAGLLSPQQISALITRFWKMTMAELAAVPKDPKSTVGEIALASIFIKAIETGDYGRIEGLLTRGIGKVKEVTEVHQHNYDDELRKVDREKIVELLKQA